MDFGSFDPGAMSEAGAVMQVINPATGKPLDGVTITVRGHDSREFRAWVAARVADDKTTDPAIVEARVVDLMARLTVAWSGVEWEGKPLACTPDNAAKVYARHGWLREQIDRFCGNRANFFGSALTA